MTAAMTTGGAARTTAPAHHLSDELLLDYAAGTLDEATSLVVASHLTLCSACRAQARKLDAVGGAFLDAMTPTAVSDGAFDAVLAALDAGESEGAAPLPRRPEPANDNPVLPRVLQRYVGGDADAIAWKKLGMGVETAEIALAAPDKRAFMLKVPGGKAVPQHTHDGNEYVLVLNGSYTDEVGTFGPGDLAISDGEIDHRPVANMGADCICLVVIDGPVRLTGPLGKILNLFVRV